MVGFGERAAGEHLAHGDPRQPGGLLFLGPEVQNDLRGEVGEGDAGAHRGVSPAQGLGHQDVFKDAQALAFVFFREMDADKPQVGGFLPDFLRKRVPGLQIENDVLFEFALDELGDGLLNFLLRLGQFKFHGYLSLPD